MVFTCLGVRAVVGVELYEGTTGVYDTKLSDSVTSFVIF